MLITDISFHAAQKEECNVALLKLMQNSILDIIHKQISKRKHALTWLSLVGRALSEYVTLSVYTACTIEG